MAPLNLDLTIDVHEIITEIRPYFEKVILQRGWDYYKADRVEDIKVLGSTKVYALVEGSEFYTVRIDLAHFPDSECNCPHDDYCKHMAAAMYTLMELLKMNPAELLSPSASLRRIQQQNQPNQLTFGFEELETTPAPATKSTLASPISKKLNILSRPSESETPREWYLYFDQLFKSYPIYHLYEVERFYNDATAALSPIASRWRPEASLFYYIHMIFYIMQKSDAYLTKFNVNTYNYYQSYTPAYHKISRHCHDLLIEQLSRKDVNPQIKLQNKAHVEETIEVLSTYVFPKEGKSAMPWNTIYYELWQQLFDHEALRFSEQKRLKHLLEKENTSALREQYILAIAHLDIIAGYDEAAQTWLDEHIERIDMRWVGNYFTHFSEVEKWDRLLSWLRWLKPFVMNATQTYTESYLHHLKVVGIHIDIEDEWLKAARDLLPESYYSYANYLFREKQYGPWIDLCMMMNYTPQDVESGVLKFIEKEEPHVLLPFYHQAVEEYLLQKNRKSYKQAVRTLKKLHRIYKKRKQMDRWDVYLAAMLKQYARFRAFHEELRKGKLIL